MKKQSIFASVILMTIFVLASCNQNKPAKVTLSNENDSLNYALGLANGEGIKSYYLRGDSSEKPVQELLNAIDKAFNQKTNKNEMYQLGLQIGNSLKQQKQHGLMGDSTLVFDTKLVIQGLVNGLNGYKEGMSAEKADEFLRTTMTALQEKKMQQQPPVPASPAPADTVGAK